MGLFRLLARLFLSAPRTVAKPDRPLRPVTFHTRVETRVVVLERPAPPPAGTVLKGRCWVIDGDTIVIDNVRLRLAGIDAPELDHPWGQRAKWALVQLCKGQIITARIRPELSYDRVVAECFLPDGRDLAAELVRTGFALDWAKFSGGRYRHLEPPDARRKLWRAEARQRGKLSPRPGHSIPE
ncbi:MAG: thermonuclease family protein [Devosia sp.]